MTYIIADIGQNHNGSVDVAREIINKAIEAGCDAIKLTMRDLDNEMTKDLAESPYKNKNSYGQTYMDHRRYLELSKEDIRQLIVYAKVHGVDPIVTFCSATLLRDEYIKEEILPKLKYIKVASRDIGNIPLIKEIANTGKPVILSSGAADIGFLSRIVKMLYPGDITILHCVSKYPTDKDQVCLSRIEFLMDHFKGKARIGYSDHSIGNKACIYASVLGAKVIKKHVTLNVNSKGSDHLCAADPSSLYNLVKEIREVSEIIGNQRDVSIEVPEKIGRSLCASRDLKEGDVICSEDIAVLSPGSGMKPEGIGYIIGKTITKDLKKHYMFKFDEIE